MQILEVGPGHNPMLGCTHYIDRKVVIVPGELMVHDIMNFPWPYQNDMFDSIVSVHCFEHFTLDQGKQILKEMHRILKSGGICQIHVPNMQEIMPQFLSTTDISAKRRMTDLLYGAESTFDPLYAHKVAYDFTFLKYQFEQIGFKDIIEVTERLEDRHDKGYKDINIKWASLKVAGTK